MISFAVLGTAAGAAWSVVSRVPAVQAAGKYLAIGGTAALILVGAYTAGNIVGKIAARAETNAAWEAKGLKNKVATLNRDLEIQRNTAERAVLSEQALAATAAGLEQKIAEYETNVPTNNACLATDADVRGLRDILGTVRRPTDGASNPARLRKPR